MALIKCAECNREVSDKAPACPGCGAPLAMATPPLPLPPPVAPAAPALVAATPAQAPKPKSGVRPLTIILLLLLAGAGYVAFQVVNRGASPLGAVTGPQTVFSEQVSLEEGAAKGYGCSLPSPRRIEVEVSATPKSVNVMLMNEDEYAKYGKARGKLFGGKYTYRQALSKQSVLHMKESEILPAGAWRIVVERPLESLFGGKAAAVTIKVLAF